MRPEIMAGPMERRCTPSNVSADMGSAGFSLAFSCGFFCAALGCGGAFLSWAAGFLGSANINDEMSRNRARERFTVISSEKTNQYVYQRSEERRVGKEWKVRWSE